MMQDAQDNISKLYSAISRDFDDAGTFEEFQHKIADGKSRRKLYDAMRNTYDDIGTYEEFEAKLGFGTGYSSRMARKNPYLGLGEKELNAKRAEIEKEYDSAFMQQVDADEAQKDASRSRINDFSSPEEIAKAVGESELAANNADRIKKQKDVRKELERIDEALQATTEFKARLEERRKETQANRERNRENAFQAWGNALKNLWGPGRSFDKEASTRASAELKEDSHYIAAQELYRQADKLADQTYKYDANRFSGNVLNDTGKRLVEFLGGAVKGVDVNTLTMDMANAHGKIDARHVLEHQNEIVKRFAEEAEKVKTPAEYKELAKKVQAALDSELSDSEKEVINAFRLYSDTAAMRQGNVSTWATAGEMAEQSLEFMLVDFGLTKGIGKGASKTLANMVGRWAREKGGIGRQIVSDIVSSAERTALLVPRNLSAYGDNLIELSGQSEDTVLGGLGNTDFRRSWFNAGVNTALSQYIEYWSEGFGEYFGAAEAKLFRATTKKLPKTVIGKSLAEYRGSIGRFLDNGKFDGMINEQLEEVVGSLFNSLNGWLSGDAVGDKEAIKDFFSGEQLSTLFLSFLPMSAVSLRTNIKAYNKMRERYDASIEVLNPYIENGTLTEEDLDKITSNLDKTPEEMKDAAVEVITKVRDANNGRLDSKFAQSLLGYVEGRLNMQLEGDVWRESAEKMQIAYSYSQAYGLPLEDNAYDAAQQEAEKRQAALDAGISEEELDKDPFVIGRDALFMKDNGDRDGQYRPLMEYANAKAISQGIKDGHERNVKEGIREAMDGIDRDLDNNGRIITAEYNGGTIFITSKDVQVVNGKVKVNGADGVVTYVDGIGGDTATVNTSELGAASEVDTQAYKQSEAAAATEEAAKGYEEALNTMSTGAMAKEANRVVGRTVRFTDPQSGAATEVQLREVRGGRVLVQGDKKMFGNGTGMQWMPIADFYNAVDKDDNGFIVATMPQGAAETKQPTAEAKQAASGSLANKKGTLNGARVEVESAGQGTVSFHYLGPDGEMVPAGDRPTEMAEADFRQAFMADGQQEKKPEPAPAQPAQAPVAAPVRQEPEEQTAVELPRTKENDVDWDKVLASEEAEFTAMIPGLVAELQGLYGDDAISEVKKWYSASKKNLDKAREELRKADSPTKSGKAAKKVKALDKEVKYYSALFSALRPEQKPASSAAAAPAQAPQAEEKEGEAPDMSKDTPEAAQKRGYIMQNGQRIDRAAEDAVAAEGAETSIAFTKNTDGQAKAHYALVDSKRIIPSHVADQENPLHFFAKNWQPKDRKRTDSAAAIQQMANGLRPQEITTGATAYNGAPIVNRRGEVIQGNGRGEALRRAYQQGSAAGYKQWLADHAAEFGLTAEQVMSMENPVLVRVMDVDDQQAEVFGKYSQGDLESGGNQRFNGEDLSKKLGDRLPEFLDILFHGEMSEESTFTDMINMNGQEALDWLHRNKFINDTEYQNATEKTRGGDTKFTEETSAAFRALCLAPLFAGASENVRAGYDNLPNIAKLALQRNVAMLSRLDGVIEDLQDALSYYHDYISSDSGLAGAKTFEEAYNTILQWSKVIPLGSDKSEGELHPSIVANNYVALLHTARTIKSLTDRFRAIARAMQGEVGLYGETPGVDRLSAYVQAGIITEDEKKEIENDRKASIHAGPAGAGEPGRSGGESRVGGDAQVRTPDKGADSQESGGTAPAERGSEEVESKSSGNTVFTEDAMKAALDRLKKNRNNLNSGINPQDMLDMLTVGGYYVEKGVRAFSAWAKQMIDAIGEWIKPYLKGTYENIRRYPGMEDYAKEMTATAEVDAVDIDKLDKDPKSEPAKTAEKPAKPSESPKSSVPSQPETGDLYEGAATGSLFGDSEEVKEVIDKERDYLNDLRLKLAEGKPVSFEDAKALATEKGLMLKDTDLQELIETAVVESARAIAERMSASPKAAYDMIVELYRNSPNLNKRDTSRVKLQQYSTPTPFGYLMGLFAKGREVKSVLEPSAGNGALTIAFSPGIVTVNDIDAMRLSNLRRQGFKEVTSRDALQPLRGEFDAVVTNPPFGGATPMTYGTDYKFTISSLEGRMAVNALFNMKDDGRAAIIIGGHTEYRENGSLQGKDAAFLGYLYQYYNVVDVINTDGALYAKNGTKYPVRIILINGRRSDVSDRHYAPVQSKAKAEQVNTFEELYNRVNDAILQSNQQGNGRKSDNAVQERGNEDGRVPSSEHAGVLGGQGSGVLGGRRGAGSTGSEQGRDGGSASGRVESGERPSGGEERLGELDSRQSGERPAVVDSGRPGPSGRDTERADSSVERGGERGSGERPEGRPVRVDADQAAGGSDVRDGQTGTRPGAQPRVGRRLERVALGQEKVSYIPQSKSPEIGSKMPAQQMQAVEKNLQSLGDVDAYLVDKLGYSSKEELYEKLAGEQIDAVALAISRMEAGGGFIIGDMTGVGKGRQAAALIRYAVRSGKKPVFFTKTPDLFSDIYRDLADIGSGNLRPFIFAAKSGSKSKLDMTDQNGRVVYSRPSEAERKRVMDHMVAKHALPQGYDYIVTTYSTFQNGTTIADRQNIGQRKQKETRTGRYTAADINGEANRNALAAITNGNIFLMDESHNAAGEGEGSLFISGIVPETQGVTFLSATFAKRPDSMPLYMTKTSVQKSGMRADEIISAVAAGGTTFQEILSKTLTEEGQMIRRERDFSGVTIDWRPIEDEAQIERERTAFDKVTAIFNHIVEFQRKYVDPMIIRMSDELAEVQGSAKHTPGTRDMGLNNTPFASKSFNVIQELLFALNARTAAQRAIEHLKEGRKPVIAIGNTMGAIMDKYPSGVDMEMPDFGTTLKGGLESILRYTEKVGDDNVPRAFELNELGTEAIEVYHAIEKEIDEASSGLPASPIDEMKKVLTDAGYTVGELTGRNSEFQYNEDGTVRKVARADRDKKRLAREFNNGNLDVVILNKSAATGISLHSSPKFGDARQRVMVFAQMQLDINDEVQMRGRIDRTGQLYRGMYEYIVSSIPAQQRLMMMFKSKLKSLDANTTSSQKSKFNEMEVVDFLNKYGNEIAVDYMINNLDVYAKLADPFKWEQAADGPLEMQEENWLRKHVDTGETGAMGRIAARLALLPSAEQEKVLGELAEAYKTKIDILNAAGENDLEITELPLNATTKSTAVWIQGTDQSSAFGSDVKVEQLEVDVLRKPMKAEEVRKSQEKFLEGKTWEQFKEEKLAQIKAYKEARFAEMEAASAEKAKKNGDSAYKASKDFLEKARRAGKNSLTDAQIAETSEVQRKQAEDLVNESLKSQKLNFEERLKSIRRVLQSFDTNTTYCVPDGITSTEASLVFPGENYAKIIGYKFNDKFTPSGCTIVFATLDGRRRVEIPLSKMNSGASEQIKSNTAAYGDSAKAVTLDTWDSMAPTQNRETVYMLTGNLLKALAEIGKPEMIARKVSGQLVEYTTDKGEVRQGILMNKGFQMNKLSSSKPISAALEQIRSLDRRESVKSTDGDVEFRHDEGYGYTRGNWGRYNNYELRVPRSKAKGGKYFLDEGLLKFIDGGEFESSGNTMRGIVKEGMLPQVLDYLSTQLGVTVSEDFQGDADGAKELRIDDKRATELGKAIAVSLSENFLEPMGLGGYRTDGQKIMDAVRHALREMRVWHGSPHNFEKFKTSYMGTGTGAQSYGWGIYTTEIRGIAEGYSKMAVREESRTDVLIDGKRMTGVFDLDDFMVEAGIWDQSDIMAASYLWAEMRAAENLDELKKELEERNGEDDKVVRTLKELGDRLTFQNEGGNLYNVEIPDDNGSNYLDNGKMYSGEEKDTLVDRISEAFKQQGLGDSFKDAAESIKKSGSVSGKYIYDTICSAFANGAKPNEEHYRKASELLSSIGFVGIKYSAGSYREGKNNYVIFKDSDLEIKEKYKFFHTPDGENYGFALGGKIYLDPKHVDPRAPIHEYGHVWYNAYKSLHPEWAKELEEDALNNPALEGWRQHVGELYGDFGGDMSAFAEEVIMHYSGAKGARLLEAEANAQMQGKSIRQSSAIFVAFEKVKAALAKFWNWLGEALNFEHKSVDEVADAIMYDLLNRVNPNEYITKAEADEMQVRESRVSDKSLIVRLDSEPTFKAYRAMQLIDGKLYPPMAAVQDGKTVPPTALGVWEQADEHPELAVEKKNKWYFPLRKNQKDTGMDARYNPYIHTSMMPRNDQFASAWGRPELVVVEVEVPESELTSGYQAEKAFLPVGQHVWNGGAIDRQLPKSKKRKVTLTRWAKPVRVLTDREVAEKMMDELKGMDVIIPENTITPGVRAELELMGAEIAPAEKKARKRPANYDAQLEAARARVNSRLLFRDGDDIFVSNAEAAVEGISMDKATPEQWLKMIERNGGLKAGEDKWIGLSDWLKSQDKKTLTKQEVADYIAQNRIQIEEVHYEDMDDYDAVEESAELVNKEYQDLGADAKALEAMKEKYPGIEDVFEVFRTHGEPNTLVYNNEYEAEKFLEKYDLLKHQINDTRKGYTTEGLQNKREIALTVPTIEPWNEDDRIHFGDAGNGRAVAWARFGETVLREELSEEGKAAEKARSEFFKRMSEKYGKPWGNELLHEISDEERDELKAIISAHSKAMRASEKRVLFIDEIQSKRHQEGREKGYRRSIMAERDAIAKRWSESGRTDEEAWKKLQRLNDELRKWEAHGQWDDNRIPAAPFEKNWHELAMKRMLRLAAEEGYDYVAWTTGDQQAERYSIGDVFSAIERQDMPEVYEGRRYILQGANKVSVEVDEKGNVLQSSLAGLEGKPLAEIAGKGIAQQMMEMTDNSRIESNEFRLGAEGMKGFYDEILPRFMNKYGKKWGVKVEDKTLNDLGTGPQTVHAVKVTPEMKESVLQGQPMFRDDTVTPAAIRKSYRSETSRLENDAESWKKLVNDYFNDELVDTRKMTLGQPSGVLKFAGIDSPSIAIGRWNLKAHVDRHKELTPETLKQFVLGLQRPVVIIKAFDSVPDEKGYLPEASGYELYHIFTDVPYYNKEKRSLEYLKAIIGIDKNNNRLFIKTIHSSTVRQILGDIGLMPKYDVFGKPTNPAGRVSWANVEKVKSWFNEVGGKKNPASNRGTSTLSHVQLLPGTLAKIEKDFGSKQYISDKNYKLYQSGRITDEGSVLAPLSPLATQVAIEREAKEWGKKFGVKIETVTREQLPEGHKAAKGYFDPESKTIYICAENHQDVNDAIRTVMHEGVAHFGLRKLFGDAFPEMMRRIFTSLGTEERRKVLSLATKYEGDVVKAMEEYMASLAEKTDFTISERTFWDKVKELFERFINSILGKETITLTDNDLRYILQASYQNMLNPGWLDTWNGKALDYVLRRELGIGEKKDNDGPKGPLFRDDSDSRDVLDRMLTPGRQSNLRERLEYQKYRMITEHQDRQHPVKLAIDLIQNQTGNKPIRESEDYLTKENLASSIARTEMDEFNLLYMEPILEQVNAVMAKLAGRKDMKGVSAKQRLELYKEVTTYLKAKSGLERNAWMRAEAESKKDGARDFSGLTAIFGLGKNEWQKAESMAMAYVTKFESKTGVEADKLWDAIRAATDYNLLHAKEHGLISEDEYYRLHGDENGDGRMWQYYLPLRGFEEETAEDVWDYHDIAFQRANSVVVKKVGGRTTESEDPLALIRNIGEMEIMQGNNNLAKIALYKFVFERPNQLMTARESWYEKDVDDTWKEAWPRTGESLEQFETRMEQLKVLGLAHLGRQGLKLNRIQANPHHANNHLIRVKINGREYGIWVNSNPEVAMAVSGNLRKDAWKGIRAASRTLSNLFTSYSIDFMARNLFRDVLYSRMAIIAKESPKYRAAFRKHWWANFGLMAAPMVKLVHQWNNGTLQTKVNPTQKEQAFLNFMRDGGATGYTIMNTTSQIRKDIERMIKTGGRASRNADFPVLGGIPIIRGYMRGVQALNEAFELLTRFTAYQAAIDTGKSRQNAASDAKEISVNFNRKGAQSGTGFWGATAVFMGATHYFYNAGVQGFSNFLGLFKKAPVKMAVGTGLLVLMGYLTPLINTLIASADGDGEGDDDDWYWNLPEWVRRNNLVLGFKGGYLAIPLAVEQRAIYGIGDIAASFAFNKRADRRFWPTALDAANQVMGILPINPVEEYASKDSAWEAALRTFFPDAGMFIIDATTNRDYTGRPLAKVNQFTKSQELKCYSAYSSTPEGIVKACQLLNRTTGIDLAPGYVRDFAKQYMGGVYSAFEKTGKVVESIFNEDKDFHLEDVPFISGFTGRIEEDRKNTFVNNALHDYEKIQDSVIKKIKTVTGENDLTPKQVFGEPLEGSARLQALYDSHNYNLAKIYYDGMHNQYGTKTAQRGKNKGKLIEDKKNVLQYGVESLRKQWNAEKETYAAMPKNTPEERKAREEQKRRIKKAWQKYYSAQCDLVDRLLEYEHKPTLTEKLLENR